MFILLVFTQTFLLYVLRSPYIGTDTYTMMMDYICSNANMLNVAPLYYFIKNIFYQFIPFQQGYMILCGIFIIGGTFYYIYRNSKNILLSIFLFFSLYFFFQSMNIARQFIAIVLVANGMVFIWENRKWIAILLFLAALFIHSTAFVLMPLLILLFINESQKRKIFLFLFCAFLMCYEPILQVFVSLFPKYDMYVESGMLFEIGKNRKVLLTIFYLFILCVSYIVYRKVKNINSLKENKQWELLIFCLSVTVLIGILSMNSILLTRIEYYFSFTLILFVPLVLSKFKLNNKPILYILTCLFFSIPGIFQFIMNYGNIRPYLFFWE